MKTFARNPETGGASEVRRLYLTGADGAPREVVALWGGGSCRFARAAEVSESMSCVTMAGGDPRPSVVYAEEPRMTLPWEAEVSVPEGHVLVPGSVRVTMGGEDVTGACYDAAARRISIPMVKGDIGVEAEATEVIEWELRQIPLASTFLDQATADGARVDSGEATFNTINGNTFVWNQLFEDASSEVATLSGAVYLKQTGGVREVFTSAGETVAADTDTDMLVNLTHLYGANTRSIPLTQEAFERLFPDDYYPYCAPKLLHMAVTALERSEDGVEYLSVNLPVKEITGRLNGSGESVTVFPNGMGGAAYSDQIYKDSADGLWKARVRMRVANVAKSSLTSLGGGIYQLYSGHASYLAMTSNNAKLAVSDKFMSSAYGTVTRYGIGVGSGSGNKTFVKFNTDDTSVLPESFALAYLLADSANKYYVLDEQWQSLLDGAFRVSGNGRLKARVAASALPGDNTPTSAPITTSIYYGIRGYAVKDICVSNFAHGRDDGTPYVEGELTAKEAAAVTDILEDGVPLFRAKGMVSFNEFKYFTGLTALNGASQSTNGTFHGCTKLESLMLPRLAMLENKVDSQYFFNGMFRNCESLKTIGNTGNKVDFSDWKMKESDYYSQMTSFNLYYMFAKSGVEKVDLTALGYITGGNGMFQNAASLKEIDFSGVVLGTSALTHSTIFQGCSSLETVRMSVPRRMTNAGAWISSNLHTASIILGDSPNLSIESIRSILASVGAARANAAITLHSTAYDRLMAAADEDYDTSAYTVEEHEAAAGALELASNKGYDIIEKA